MAGTINLFRLSFPFPDCRYRRLSQIWLQLIHPRLLLILKMLNPISRFCHVQVACFRAECALLSDCGLLRSVVVRSPFESSRTLKVWNLDGEKTKLIFFRPPRNIRSILPFTWAFIQYIRRTKLISPGVCCTLIRLSCTKIRSCPRAVPRS